MILTIAAIIGCLSIPSCEDKAQEPEKYIVRLAYRYSGYFELSEKC